MTAVDTSVSCVFHDPTTSEIYTLSLHDALPIFPDQVTTGFPVVAGYRAFAGVVVEAAFAGSGVQAEDGIGGQGAKTHGGNVEHTGAIGFRAVSANHNAEVAVIQPRRGEGVVHPLEAFLVHA